MKAGAPIAGELAAEIQAQQQAVVVAVERKEQRDAGVHLEPIAATELTRGADRVDLVAHAVEGE